MNKIFREGISESDVFIVVVMRYSVERPWVIEEFDAAVVDRIAGKVNAIIPIVMDRIVVPRALAATVWITLDDVGDLEPALDQISQEVFGAKSDAVAALPPWTQHRYAGAHGLSPIDEMIFGFITSRWMETNYPVISISGITECCKLQQKTPGDLSAEEFAVAETPTAPLGLRMYGKGFCRVVLLLSDSRNSDPDALIVHMITQLDFGMPDLLTLPRQYIAGESLYQAARDVKAWIDGYDVARSKFDELLFHAEMRLSLASRCRALRTPSELIC